MSSALHRCIKSQHLKTDSILLPEVLLFSSEILNPCEEPQMPFKYTFIFP